MFEAVEKAAADPILGLTEAFRAETNPDKINLGVGVFRDADGNTPILKVVKEAEKLLLASETTKSYLPIDGDPQYCVAVQQLLFGGRSSLLSQGRLATSQTPGGTAALRVCADYLAEHHHRTTVWLSDPTWANHGSIFQAAGVQVRKYAYYSPQARALNLEGMLTDLGQVAPGDTVLLHAVCHNPTGVDPTADDWKQIGEVLEKRGALPLMDFAYQGFAAGVDEDAHSVRLMADMHAEVLVCSSFSKNFGLYRERTGALTVVAKNSTHAEAVHSNIKISIRRHYSNPPSHGAAVVRTVVQDAKLNQAWRAEVAAMRDRINSVRRDFSAALQQRNVQLSPTGNDFMIAQKGMFSFTGLTAEQIGRLRAEYAVYMVGSGRINVAGITPGNLHRLADAIAAVVK